MQIRLKRQNGVNFIAHTQSGHQISMDGASNIGGEDKGARPMETVLAGLGGCSAIDVMLILEKSRQQVRDCEIIIDATRADDIPAVFTKIHLHFIVSGENLKENNVKRAVDLSVEKYCSVAKMLRSTADISADYEIIQL